MNFLREKAMNKINELNKKIEENNNLIKKEKQDNNTSFNQKKEKNYEIINTDIIPENNNEKEVQLKNEIELNEEKEEITKEKENDIKINKDEENKDIVKKTPNKESSYLVKIKQLGSMSKLSLCNKIQKYTEICQQVLKEQENGEENIIEAENKGKGK